MRRDRLVRALRGEETDTTPIWLMRQAGRHLPGYRKLRQAHTLLEIARTPELAAEVTLEPVRRYDVDSAVVFADISLPFLGLGVPFSIDAGVGPVVEHPLRTRADVEALTAFDARSSVPFVGAAIERFLSLESERPILGFAGGPFTLAAYLVEGRPSREYIETKRMIYGDPGTFDRLIARLTDMTIDYLKLQAESGAAALQLFDSWAGAVTPSVFEHHLLEPLRSIFEQLGGTRCPTVYFSTGSSHLVELLARTGADALGVDWREPLGRVRRRIGPAMALQGNLDPGALLGTRRTMLREARVVLDEVPDGRAHVFNLGHGVLPETDPERVRDLVEFVHESGRSTEGAMNREAESAATSGVLLMGYGSPNGAADLPAYLADVLHGQPPSPDLVAEYVRRYDRIGGSPQNRILASLRSKLEKRLGRDASGTRVFLGVKHGHPALRDVIPEAARSGFRHLVAVPLSPYASTWISEPYRQGVAEGTRAAPSPIDVDVRLGWHLDPNWIGYWKRAIRAELASHPAPEGAVLLSAHSLPQRMRDLGDPYPEILNETADRIAREAGLDRWSFTYQSPGNTTEPWLGPDITDVMLDWMRGGARRQLVASFGFVFDHLEVLYDLDVVVREFAEGQGIEDRRVPMPNDADEVVEALASRVQGDAGGARPHAGP